MDDIQWFNPDDFPGPDEYGTVDAWAEAITTSIETKESYEVKRHVGEILKQEFKTFPQAYAMAEMDDHPILRHGLLKAATRKALDTDSDSRIESNADRLKDRFRDMSRVAADGEGWVAGDPSLALDDTHLSNDDYVLIRNSLIRAPDDTIREENIISRKELREVAEETLEAFYGSRNTDDVYDDLEVEAVVATIETRIRDQDWINLGYADKDGRLWVEPEEILERLSLLEEADSFLQVDVEKEVRGVLDGIDICLPKGVVFNLDPIVEKLGEAIREEGWRRVLNPFVDGDDVEFEVQWFLGDGLSERLRELDNQYRECFENPRHEGDIDEIEKRRRETFLFYKKNGQQLDRQDFFETIGDVDGQLKRFKGYVEIMEDWQMLEDAEVVAGDWDPGDDNWKQDDVNANAPVT